MHLTKTLHSWRVLTIEDKEGPSRSHWFSIFWMRESINEALAFASAWASVRNLMQSWHTASLSYRKGNIWGHVGKIWLLVWVRVNFKKSTCFGVSCWGDSCLGLSWGYRSWGTLTMKGDARWERSTLGISLDMSCSVASALAKAACSDWHSPMAAHTTPGFSLKTHTILKLLQKQTHFYSTV